MAAMSGESTGDGDIGQRSPIATGEIAGIEEWIGSSPWRESARPS